MATGGEQYPQPAHQYHRCCSEQVGLVATRELYSKFFQFSVLFQTHGG